MHILILALVSSSSLSLLLHPNQGFLLCPNRNCLQYLVHQRPLIAAEPVIAPNHLRLNCDDPPDTDAVDPYANAVQALEVAHQGLSVGAHDGKSFVGLISAAFRYLPFGTAWKGCSCHSCCRKEEDFDNIKFPDFAPGFSPGGERIHAYPPAVPMRLQDPAVASIHGARDLQLPPLAANPARAAPPPGYDSAVRDALRSPDDRPMVNIRRPLSSGVE
ncbi:hypothetical protein B0H15DRAFT_1026459 [Mycena belliarum]|uniref:Secreted protein n=1 Tax=Mycena belliarum TaxID=1033014 RepID=A0AAD6XNA0_9AGAR|nr:hypothetical protein B0H15DRAFT_1026459 [Mycena belliae]